MKSRRAITLLIALLLCAALLGEAALAADAKAPADKMSAKTFAGLTLRQIGPALISGRVVAIAVDPGDRAHYYVGAASGGVWVTKNDGGTWTPVFDHEGSYSIGAIAIDPKNPSVVWVGTGEGNSQRSVAYGDGVYRSNDGGASWTNMGLKDSQHIGKIVEKALHAAGSDHGRTQALQKLGGSLGRLYYTGGMSRIAAGIPTSQMVNAVAALHADVSKALSHP